MTGCSDTPSAPTELDRFVAALANLRDVTTPATGEAIFTLYSDSTVGYRIRVNNIQNVTAAHIHEGGAGATGLLTRMGTGTVYLNVHTQAHPGGEIRGQIIEQ